MQLLFVRAEDSGIYNLVKVGLPAVDKPNACIFVPLAVNPFPVPLKLIVSYCVVPDAKVAVKEVVEKSVVPFVLYNNPAVVNPLTLKVEATTPPVFAFVS